MHVLGKTTFHCSQKDNAIAIMSMKPVVRPF